MPEIAVRFVYVLMIPEMSVFCPNDRNDRQQKSGANKRFFMCRIFVFLNGLGLDVVINDTVVSRR